MIAALKVLLCQYNIIALIYYEVYFLVITAFATRTVQDGRQHPVSKRQWRLKPFFATTAKHCFGTGFADADTPL